MDGILTVIKPPNMTSFDVVAFLRGVTKTKKIGHTGTLDPGAVGVLTLCFGNATKAVDYIMALDKEYIGQIKFGKSTDTLDSYGEVLESKEPSISFDTFKRACSKYIGESYQMPPMYSAIKIKGKKLYELARRGIDVEREKRRICIDSIDVLKFVENKEAHLKVVCQKGTYIRSLFHDISKSTGNEAHMGFLVRTRNGPFTLEQSYTLEEILDCKEKGILEKCFTGVERVFESYPSVRLNEKQFMAFRNGVFIDVKKLDGDFKKDEIYAVYYMDKFIAIGMTIMKGNRNYFKSKKFF